jgi:hypothetical protein
MLADRAGNGLIAPKHGEYQAALPGPASRASEMSHSDRGNRLRPRPGEVVRSGFLYRSQLGHGQILGENLCYGRAGRMNQIGLSGLMPAGPGATALPTRS